jgi:hypothetical protein
MSLEFSATLSMLWTEQLHHTVEHAVCYERNHPAKHIVQDSSL